MMRPLLMILLSLSLQQPLAVSSIGYLGNTLWQNQPPPERSLIIEPQLCRTNWGYHDIPIPYNWLHQCL